MHQSGVVATPGLTLEGKCENKSCEAYGRQVLMNQGMANFDILYDKSYCPICKGDVKAFTCGFSNCRYRFVGQKSNGTIVDEKEWSRVGNEFNRFSKSKSKVVHWKSLVCLTRSHERVCFLCMQTISEKSEYYCKEGKHAFHRNCVDRILLSSTSIVCVQCI